MDPGVVARHRARVRSSISPSIARRVDPKRGADGRHVAPEYRDSSFAAGYFGWHGPGPSTVAAIEVSTVDVIELTGEGLEPADVVAVAREDAPVTLGGRAREAMRASAAIVERLADSDEPAYGISTGFGSLATTPIPAARREELQRALIRSHAAGMGPPVEPEVVRAMLLLRARTLAMGYSGARPIVAETILALLNAGLTPVVPCLLYTSPSPRD